MKNILLIVFFPCFIVAQGHLINVAANIQIKGNTYLIGKEVTLTNLQTNNLIENEGEIQITGNLENYGTISGTLILDGLGNKNTYLGTLETFENKNNGIITMMNDCSISRLLKLTKGTIDANGNDFVLKSDAVRTALVHDNGGSTQDNFIVERYIPPALGHHFLSAPTTNATINQLSDDLPILLNVAFPNVYYYDELITNPDRDLRWVAPTSPSYPMTAGQGITFYFNPGSGQVVDIEGPLNTATINIPLTFTQSIPALSNPNASNSPEGWNFIGNPYPSPIDFDQIIPLKPSTMLYSMYRWDPNTQSYISYINGVSSHQQFNQYIPSMQGFWVRVNNNTPISGTNLILENSCRVTEPDTAVSPFLKVNAASVPTMRYQLSSSNSTALSVLYFDDDATNNFDEAYDAYYLEADQANSVEFASVCGVEHLSINGLDSDSMFQAIIPLSHVVKSLDQYTIEITEFSNFPTGVKVVLQDKLLGLSHFLHQSPYHFQANPLQDNDRFQINFLPAHVSLSDIQADAPFQLFKNGDYLQIDLNHAFRTETQLRIYNLLGQTVYQQELLAGITTHQTLSLRDIPTGTVLVVDIDGFKQALEFIW